MEDKKEPVSRRAFLRRAGATALSTGAKIVPGLAAANAALKAGAQQTKKTEEDSPADAGGQEDPCDAEEGTEAKDGP